MAIGIKKIMGIDRSSIRKLNSLQLSEELFNNPLFSDANLVSYWRMEGNSNDSKGSNNGSDSNVTYGNSYGKFNQGWKGNGISSVTTTPLDLNSYTNLSIAFWMKPTSNDLNGLSPISSDVDARFGKSVIFYPTNAKIGIEYQTGTATGSFLDTDFTCSADTWYHVVVVFTSTTIKVYVNGSEVKSSTISQSNDNQNHVLKVGKWNSSDPRWWNGSVDDLAIFNRVLTADEVLNIYQSQIKKFAGVSNI